MHIEAKWTTDLNSKIYQDALNIRHEVFVAEQKVPVNLEIDDLEDQTEHIVLYKDDEPIGTARIYDLGNAIYKVQRVATKKEVRGQGYGAALMKQIERKIKEIGG